MLRPHHLLVALALAAVLFILPSALPRSSASRALRRDEDAGVEQVHEDLFQAMAVLVPPGSGYQLTEHFTTTDDGYILRMFRLLYPGQESGRWGSHKPTVGNVQKPVVYLQHALLDSSGGYLIRGPDKSLGFILAKAGFDVWLGNIRGNRFSRNHTRWDPDSDPEFWAYTVDEHACLDLPAMLQAVVDHTGVPNLGFVGYSQGTTMALALLSSRPDWARRITVAALLAPVGFVGHITSIPFRAMLHLKTAEVYQYIGLKEFGAHDPYLAALSGTLCTALPGPCTKWIGIICGANSDGNLEPGILAPMMEYLPSGTSVANMMWWAQSVRAKGRGPRGIRMMDFGTECPADQGTSEPGPELFARPGYIARPRMTHDTCNQWEYGQLEPPAYDLSHISTPLALFTGGTDTLSDPMDVELLLEALPPGVVVHRTHMPEYGHLDFGLGTDAPDRLYPHVLQVLRERAPSPTAAGH